MGFQSYFRLLFGLTLILLGVAVVVSRVIGSWLGWVAALAGVLSVAIGIDVGYAGLESGFQDAASVVFQLLVLAFVIGILVTGQRRGEPAARG